MFSKEKSKIKGKDGFNEYLEEQIQATENRSDVSTDTKIICFWLYIIAKHLVTILVKQ